MRWLPCLLGFAAAGVQAQAPDIVDVLRSSQQRRLEAFTPAPDGPRAQRLLATFERLRSELAPDAVVQLHVVTGPTLAETLHGHIVIASESLGDAPEGVRVFVLAHELGHVVQHHWRQVGLLYKRWVPGDVTPQTTDPVAGPLGRAASGQAHRHEFEADAFALRALHRLGRPPGEAYEAFVSLGMTQDTATHPGTRKRIAYLRAVESGTAPPSGADAE